MEAHWWVVAGVVFLIAEVFTAGFFLACFAIGCLFSASVSAAGYGTTFQLLGFSGGAMLSFFFLRPVIISYFHKREEGVSTNVDALIGRQARVVEEINNRLERGRVTLDGDNWRAIAHDNIVHDVGTNVKVVSVDGARLLVSK